MARQVLVLQLIVVLVLVVTALALATYDARNDIRASAQDEAVSVAKAVARSPVVREAMATSEPTALLQPYAEAVRVDTGVDFVVVMDRDRTRWSHPNEEQLGKAFIAQRDVGKEQVMVHHDDIGVECVLARLHHEAVAMKRAIAAEAVVAGGRDERPDRGVVRNVREFGGMWRNLSWDGAQAEAGERLPHIDGLPVLKVQVQSGDQGQRPVMVVAQQLASGEVIQTIEGPASDVSLLLARRSMAASSPRSFSGLPGVTIHQRRSRLSRRRATRLTCRCPRWAGLNEPP